MGIKLIIFVIIGSFYGASFVKVFNSVPARWLCDYQERPPESLLGVRLEPVAWTVVTSLLFSILSWHFSVQHWHRNGQEVLSAVTNMVPFTDGREIALLLINIFFDLTIVWLILQVALADLKYKIIPDQGVVALLAVGMLSFLIGDVLLRRSADHPTLIFISTHMGGFLLGGGSFFLLTLIGGLMRREIVGFGDVKLLAAVGFIMGVSQIVEILWLALLSSAILFTALLLLGKVRANEEQPLGPYIAFATIAVLLHLPLQG